MKRLLKDALMTTCYHNKNSSGSRQLLSLHKKFNYGCYHISLLSSIQQPATTNETPKGGNISLNPNLDQEATMGVKKGENLADIELGVNLRKEMKEDNNNNMDNNQSNSSNKKKYRDEQKGEFVPQ
ncbi:hypothetical protein ABK040_002782 [Willaertia magna]